MRALTVVKRCYIFDFDHTLVITDAKIHIYHNNVYVRSIDSRQFNSYVYKPGDKLDFSDFNDGERILRARKYKAWPIIRNISKAIKENRSTSEIYILTARLSNVKSYIYEYLKQNGINIELSHILTIDDETGKINISKEKQKILTKLAAMYDEVYFFDDDLKNIKLAQTVKKVKARLIEDAMGGVSAPMATLNNTPGMGNVVPAGTGTIGSGDKFANTINKKPYTQASKKRKKKKMKKINEKQINEVKFNKNYETEYTDAVDEFIMDLSEILPSAMEIYLPERERIELYNLVEIEKYSVKSILWSDDDDRWSEGYGYSEEWYEKHVQKYLDKGWEEFWFEDNEDQAEWILVKKRIIKETVEELDENNINPRDKIGMAMAKKMKIKPPFKKKVEKGNQNAIKQQKFEHEILTFDEFSKELNESFTEFTEDTPLEVHETTGTTFTSVDWETTLKSLKDGGWKFDDEEIEKLSNGESVVKYTYNRAGVPRKLVFKRADIK